MYNIPFFFLLFYLKGRVIKETETVPEQDLPSGSSISKCLQQPELVQAKDRTKSLSRSPMWVSGMEILESSFVAFQVAHDQ